MNKDEDFKKMVNNLQKKIDREEENIYSKNVLKEYRNPTNFGYIENPDATGFIKGPCGDTIKIDLMINNNKIINALFWTDGCGASIACGNMLTKIIKGITIEQAMKITNDQLTSILGGLPKENLHCSKLAVDTLHEAIKNYHKKGKIK
jgi:nitrogen fixation NifU-like protein